MLDPCAQQRVKMSSGGTLFVAEYGNCRDPQTTIIFVNGLGGTIGRWLPIIESLLQQLPTTQCITYEHRGHTESTHVFSDAAKDFLDIFTVDLKDITEKISLHPPIFVAHSMGCLLIERWLQTKTAAKYRAVIQISPPYHLPILPAAWQRPTYRLLARWSKKHASPENIELPSRTKNELEMTHDLSLKRLVFEIRTLGLVPFILTWVCLLSSKHSTSPRIYRPDTPPLFVFGSEDTLIPEKVSQTVTAQYGAEHVVTLDANHNMLTTKPRELAELLARTARSESGS